MDNDGDVCSCAAEKLDQAWQAKSTKDWYNYAMTLEVENYELQRQVAELEDELEEERARCQNCGVHK